MVTEYKDKKDIESKYDENLKEEILGSKIPPKVPKLEFSSTIKFKKARQDFSKLLGLPVTTEIDKKLLFGIFDRPS